MSEHGFTASNGWRLDDEGCLRTPNGTLYASSPEVSRLRSFFQEERDHALGRWRDPERPDWVCYPRGEYLRVVDEGGGYGDTFFRQDDVGDVAGDDSTAAAARYFAAHPAKTAPTVPGYYIRRSEKDHVAGDLWNRSRDGWWSKGMHGAWLECKEADLPDDLVRLVPEGAE